MLTSLYSLILGSTGYSSVFAEPTDELCGIISEYFGDTKHVSELGAGNGTLSKRLNDDYEFQSVPSDIRFIENQVMPVMIVDGSVVDP